MCDGEETGADSEGGRSALRREKLRALIEAVRKRQALVERIEICQERLARAFGEAARPLGKALEGRVKNLRD